VPPMRLVPTEEGFLDNIYRAIGKFVVEFSQLQHMMEYMTVVALSQDGDRESSDRAWAVVSGRTAQPVVDGFFSLCVQIYKNEWTEEDFALLKAARKEIQNLIEERNRLAHDVWSLGHPNYPVPEGFDALRFKYGTSASKGALRSARPVTVSELDAMSNKLRRLNSFVRQVGLLMCFPPGGQKEDSGAPQVSLQSYRLTEYVRVNEDGTVIMKGQESQ